MFDFLSLGDRSWLWAGTALYTIGFVFALSFLVRARTHSRPALFAIVLAGFTAQTIGLYLRGLEIGSCPLGNTFEIIQFVVWSLVLLYMAVGPVFRMSLLGFFTSGLAAALGVLSLSIPDWDIGRREHVLGPNVWIELHAALAIFSYGVFALLSLTAAMYLVQNYSLKRKKLKGMSPFLPSLIQLDQMILRLLLTGVAILTASLVLGSIYWARDIGTVDWPKMTVTIGIWVAYLVLAWLRWRRRVVAHTLAWTCILLFVVALASIWPVTASHFTTEAPEEVSHPGTFFNTRNFIAVVGLAPPPDNSGVSDRPKMVPHVDDRMGRFPDARTLSEGGAAEPTPLRGTMTRKWSSFLPVPKGKYSNADSLA